MFVFTSQEGSSYISSLSVLPLALAAGVLPCPLVSGIVELKMEGEGKRDTEVEASATMSYPGCG